MAVPIRSCCACRKKIPKHELQRYVWREGTVELDEKMQKSGRGVYCCKSEKCYQLFVGRKKNWKRLFRL